MILKYIKANQWVLMATFILMVAFAQAQNYVIIHVKGKITLVETSTPIKRGDKIAGDQGIRFDSPDAIAAVLSSDRGRFILKPGADEKADNDLLYIFKSAVTPMRGRMSTRAGGINNALDFNKFFGDQFAFIGEDLMVKVSGSSYPQNESNFFYIQYLLSGEMINKRLSFSSDTLLISKSELLSVDGAPISASEVSNYALFYYSADQQSSQLVTSINFVMLSNSEFSDIVSAMKEYEVEIDGDSVLALVSELYGNCQKDNVAKALATISN